MSSNPDHSKSTKELASRIAEVIRSKPNNDTPLAECLSSIRYFRTQSSQAAISELEEEIQGFYISHVNQADVQQLLRFLSVLHALMPTLPATSVITSWFDLALRPALRTTGLRKSAVLQARELVLHGLGDNKEPKCTEFRRRIIDLYLLDVFKDTSGDDAVEKVTMDAAEQERQRCWKTNLEEILLADGILHPKEFFEQINQAFSSPPARLQIMVLLSQLARQPDLSMSEFASSPLMSSLLLSLQADNSTTLISVGISVLIMMLPKLAVEAAKRLNDALPQLLVILSRVICWKERSSTTSILLESENFRDKGGSVIRGEGSITKSQALMPGVEWIRLESTFDLAVPSSPDAHLFFQFLYGLWPCNVLTFLRRPINYLLGTSYKCPFIGGWEDLIDEDEVQSRAKPILRAHICHPSIILRDATSELSNLTRWSADGLDVPGIVSECNSLDIRNAASASSSRATRSKPSTTAPQTALEMFEPTKRRSPASLLNEVDSVFDLSTPHPRPQQPLQLPQPGADEDSETAKAITAVTRIPIAQFSRLQDDPNSTPVQAAESGISSSPPIQELVANHVVLKSSTIGLDFSLPYMAEPPARDEDTTSPQLEDTAPTKAISFALGPSESSRPSPSIPPTPRSPNLQPSSPFALPSPLPFTPPIYGSPSPRLRFKPLDVSQGTNVTEGSGAGSTHGPTTNAEEAISTLQRDVLLLRNELNFELWLKKQHMSHMGTLHKDRIVARREEAERQGLHNKLKHHKALLHQRTEELEKLRAQSSSNKTKQNDWIKILQDKLNRYREEKQSWLKEAVELRGEVNEAKVLVKKQKAILDETEKERFELQNQLNSILPKIPRITEYERTIDALTRKQMLWDDSDEMRQFREEKLRMEQMVNDYGKMEQMVQSLEGSNRSLEEIIEDQRKKLRAMEQQAKPSPSMAGASPARRSSISSARSLSGIPSTVTQSPNVMANALNVAHSRLHSLETEYENVREKNIELEEKVEELSAMLEILRIEGGAPRRSIQARDLRAGGLGVC